jgi:hypothetical protein
MIKHPSKHRLHADFKQAASLLRDKNLVWSADLDSIREDLADYIEQALDLGYASNRTLQHIVQALIADENDITIGD